MSVAPSTETIRVEVPTRWDAVDLARRLHGLHTYLVQLGDRRWHVCVRCDGAVLSLVPMVQAAAEQWAKERHVDGVMRFGDTAVEIVH